MNKEKTIIYFVRHGQVYKPKDIWAGILNLHFKLSKKGRDQIKKLNKYLYDKDISIIYSSPIVRAYQSARIISEYLKKKIIKTNQLFEFKYSWKAQKESEIKKLKEFKIYLSKPTKLRGGETLNQLADRMYKLCIKTIRKHKGEKIICVSHQDPIRALRLKLEKRNLDLLNKVRCEKGSITAFYFKGNKLTRTKYIEPI